MPRRGEVSQSAFEEEDRALLAFIRHDLSEGQASRVIDANVDELPTGPAHLVAPIAGDAVTGTHDGAQLFDVEVEPFALGADADSARPEAPDSLVVIDKASYSAAAVSLGVIRSAHPHSSSDANEQIIA